MTTPPPSPAERRTRCALRVVLAAAGCVATAAPAAAQQVVNVATASFAGPDGRPVTVQSNQVQFTVRRADVNAAVRIYRFSDGAGSSAIPVAAPMCRGSGGNHHIGPAGVFADLDLSPASLVEAQAIRAGEPIVIGVEALQRNSDSAAIDRFDLTIASAGDREIIEVVETAPDSGFFTAYLPTSPFPETPVAGDCVMTVAGGTLSVDLTDGSFPIGSDSVDVLVDPFGEAFDSSNGRLLPGTRVTLVDAVSGQPATVFGDDGVSRFPSSLTVGETVQDSAGNSYVFPEGFYRFPFVVRGDYRLVVTPPEGYDFPSQAPAAQIATLTRPGGGGFTIGEGSYGRTFTLDRPEPVRVDIPLDPRAGLVTIRKTAARTTAEPGDAIGFLVEFANNSSLASGPMLVRDALPPGMRLRRESVRLDGSRTPVDIARDGRGFTLAMPELAPETRYRLSYIAEVRSDARSGTAVNIATIGPEGAETAARADAAVRIERDGIAERLTLVGRVTTGGCTTHFGRAKGVAGVRVMLENGIQTVTDDDGRYHFEGIKAGTHVVQIDPDTLPADQRPVDCAANSRSAGSVISRFVTGLKGGLKRADFYTVSSPGSPRRAAASAPLPTAVGDSEAAGGTIGAGQASGAIAWLFPEPEHNPRAKAVRVAISHPPGHSVRLRANDKPVDQLSFDGTQKSADGTGAISLWRGIPLIEGDTRLAADIVAPDGTIVTTIDRTVHYAGAPMRAQLVREASRLTADGVGRPVIAVRLTDSSGRPIQHGAVGDFRVSDPYRPAQEIDAQQAEQLAGLERARPVWRVIGDEGIAYIELEPTSASGSLSIGFTFRDGKVVREQTVEAWLEPGDRPWTVIGLAEGSAGYARLNGALEPIDAGESDDKDIDLDGRIALYANGRVTGKWLLTLAYDSDKQEDEERFGGVIDPTAYYTIYADRAEQRYDAASVRKLYVKLERPQFYALFGDYATGIDEPVLSRYQRAFNGLKAEYRSPQVHGLAFAADTPNRFRRVELQGSGLTGPYDLGSRTIVPNSEQIVIEVRDRFRSDRIVESRQLARHIDYDIDYSRGSVRFREPVLSRTSALDPQFVVVNYETDGVGERVVNAGGRLSWNDREDRLRIGATLIRDEDERGVSEVGGVDARLRIGERTELRGELALSDHGGRNGNAANGTGHAWLVEAEHHDEAFDLLAYARRQTEDFGVGQLNRAESGTLKYGLDGRVRLTDSLEANLSGWQEIFDDSDARRRAAAGEVAWKSAGTRLAAGLVHAEDRLDDGSIRRSTLARASASQKLFGDALELGVASEIALGGQDESADFPARHRLSARWALRPDIALIGAYEIAEGEAVEARTARVGFDIAPWSGARLLASANRQDIAEYGARSYAAYGLSQSFRIDEKWSVDVTVDGNRTIGSTDTRAIVNPDQPLASGGHLGREGQLTEDFLSVTAGATYRGDRWSLVSRAEWRNGEDVDRYGATLGVIRQIGEGRAVGGLLSWTRAEGEDGARTEVASLEASLALRPADSRWSLLDKVELRHDSVSGAVTGAEAPLGGALFLTGDASSRRAINHLAINYTPVRLRDMGGGDRRFAEAGEYSLYWGTRYVSEAFGDADVKGWSNVIAADMRFDLSEKVDVGAQASVRVGTDARTVDYSVGPSVTVVPFDNANLTVGYNFSGYRDRDFEEARTTREGVYVTFKLKFDQTSFAGLGL